MRFANPRTQDRQQGAAIIELALAMLLMLGMLLFIIFSGRFLAERNRILAANRTVAWIYAHKEEAVPESARAHRMEDPEMLLLLRQWHFKAAGIAAGVVRLGSVDEGRGLFWRGGGSIADIMGYAATAGDHEDRPDDLSESKTTDTNPSEEDTSEHMVDNVDEGMGSGLSAMLGQDFKHYHARITYGMPLVFPREAYAVFWGGVFSGVHEVNLDDSADALQVSPGETYVFFRSDAASGCVMPSLDPSVEGALGGLTGTLGGFMDNLRDLMDKVPPLYRPHMSVGETLHEPTQKRLEALLIYEIEDYDVGQKHARGQVGWWATWRGVTPWWR